MARSSSRAVRLEKATQLLLAAAITVLAGRWGLGLCTTSEFVHFSVNFPTVPGSQLLPLASLGGPWARLTPAPRGYPAGGVLAWGREGRIDVDLGSQGALKDLIQPWRVRLSTHWLRNVGARPYRVRLELEACGLAVRWVTFERAWNPEAHLVIRPLAPRQTFSMDWIFDVPPERRSLATICEAELRVLEADSGALLTRLPIRILDSRRRGHRP